MCVKCYLMVSIGSYSYHSIEFVDFGVKIIDMVVNVKNLILLGSKIYLFLIKVNWYLVFYEGYSRLM